MQKELTTTDIFPFVDKSTKLLLHSCCAPCSGSMIKVLVDLGIQVTILWYNPNIHPRAEYEIRKQENLKYAIKLEIPFVDLDYDTKEWFKRAKGMELDPERGGRCTMCFDMRMERTALYAHENNFQYFTTTNATSRWKDVEQVNNSGRKAALHYNNLYFWEYNWQTDKLTQLKYEVSAENSFYKQEYCGCVYSLRDTNAYRKLNNQSAVVIGGGGIFTDPLLDAAEESQENVDAFFHTTNTDLQAMYSSRRKYITPVVAKIDVVNSGHIGDEYVREVSVDNDTNKSNKNGEYGWRTGEPVNSCGLTSSNVSCDVNNW